MGCGVGGVSEWAVWVSVMGWFNAKAQRRKDTKKQRREERRRTRKRGKL